jgi:Ca2+-binding RTX toxin-like protein
MARVIAHSPFNMLGFDAFYGVVANASATNITIVNGPNAAYYYGNFRYDAFGEVFGTLNAVDVVINNQLVFSADQFSASANEISYYVNTNQVQTAFARVLSGNDIIYGSAGNDVLAGFGGSDDILAGPGNDIIIAGPGSDYIDGGSGLDVVVYAGSSLEYGIFVRGSEIRVDKGNFNVDELFSVERLSFTNGTRAFDIDGTAGQVYRLYQAAFDRVPDLGGLSFNVGQADQGVSLHRLADIFINSPEFIQTYGRNLTNEAFVDELYFNVLGRPGEAAGFNYWVDTLYSGQFDRADVLRRFSESDENYFAVLPQIEDGIWLV